MKDEDKFIFLRDLILDKIKKNYPTDKINKRLLKKIECKQLMDLCVTRKLDELVYCLSNNDSPFKHKCQICMKATKFRGSSYDLTCRSKKCLCEILLRNEKIAHKHQFIIDEYLNGNKEFNQIQAGLIEKYHVFSNSQIDGWHNSIEKTWKNKTPEELKSRREKIIKTCNEKYGTNFPQQNATIKDKQKQTWADKTASELLEKNEKRKVTTLKKYGVDHVMKSEKILNDVKARHFKENGFYHWIQANISHKDIYFDDVLLKEYIINSYENNRHKKIKKTVLDKFFNINTLSRLKNLNLMKYVQVSTSNLEEILKNVFDKNGIVYKWRNRSIIDGLHGKSHCYEIDFYLPDYNVGIEVNDISSHNDFFIIDKEKNPFSEKYHLYKTDKCKEKGVRLIHLWEWELKKSYDKTIAWLLNELNGEKNKIYARQCTVKCVPTNEEKEFLNMYHLQGYSKSKHCLGLYHNNELVELMSFSKARFDKKYQYELLRLCSKFNLMIIGGAKRLFDNFIELYSPESIISYCDYSKFSGNVYKTIGMQFEKLSKPTIIYCNYDMNVVHESMLMKYGVDNILKTNYGKGADNRQSIISQGYLPVHTCGNLIFSWKNKKEFINE